MLLYPCYYMINNNENEDENEKRSHRYDKNKPWFRNEHKYSKYKNCLTIMMLICIKQHLNNIWSSIHERVQQRWGWVEKKCCLYKKVCSEGL